MSVLLTNRFLAVQVGFKISGFSRSSYEFWTGGGNSQSGWVKASVSSLILPVDRLLRPDAMTTR